MKKTQPSLPYVVDNDNLVSFGIHLKSPIRIENPCAPVGIVTIKSDNAVKDVPLYYRPETAAPMIPSERGILEGFEDVDNDLSARIIIGLPSEGDSSELFPFMQITRGAGIEIQKINIFDQS